MNDLVDRLRVVADHMYATRSEEITGPTICDEAADHIEAQDKRIAELEKELDEKMKWASNVLMEAALYGRTNRT